MKLPRPELHTLALMILIATVEPMSAQGATATAAIAVSATVTAFCTISVAALGFGNYTSAVNNATTTVTASCTSGTTYNLGLDAGLGTGATVAARKMSLSTNLLTYSLYSDSGHSVVWGSSIGTNTVTGTGTGVAQVVTVYGQIPASQLVAPGNYADTVTATITY